MAADPTIPAFAARTSVEQVEEGWDLAPRFDAQGLLPVVTTDAGTGEVLMLGYMNAEALAETIARLSHVKNVAGVKEASGSMQQVIEIIATAAPDFAVWSGDDVMTLPIMAAGGVGVISVTSNVAPQRMVDLANALLEGDLASARGRMHELLPLVRALTMQFEVNPIPVKTALALMGCCTEEFRLPLMCMSPANRDQLERALRDYGIL